MVSRQKCIDEQYSIHLGLCLFHMSYVITLWNIRP